MAKKSKIKYYIPGAIALLFGIAAFCMMFLDAVSYVGKIGGSTISVSGMDLAFGSKNTDIPGVTIEVLQFNIMVTLAYVLPLLGGIISLITGKSFIGKIIATACFVVGARPVLLLSASYRIRTMQFCFSSKRNLRSAPYSAAFSPLSALWSASSKALLRK